MGLRWAVRVPHTFASLQGWEACGYQTVSSRKPCTDHLLPPTGAEFTVCATQPKSLSHQVTNRSETQTKFPQPTPGPCSCPCPCGGRDRSQGDQSWSQATSWSSPCTRGAVTKASSRAATPSCPAGKTGQRGSRFLSPTGLTPGTLSPEGGDRHPPSPSRTGRRGRHLLEGVRVTLVAEAAFFC